MRARTQASKKGVPASAPAVRTDAARPAAPSTATPLVVERTSAAAALHEPEQCNDDMSRSTMFGTSFTFSYRVLTTARNASLVMAILLAAYTAFTTRTLSIKMYGYLIHEFDPWFNFRATQYMSDHGWEAFFHWFDYKSWYPLGRPVGSTTYPGLQITAVAIHRALNHMGMEISLNNVCVLTPAWFGAVATIILAALTYEASGSVASACVAAWVFCILPAHLMRSMAGEFDNECIALAAMLLTFYLWVRSLRCPRSWPIGVLAGLAYGYMVAAWGGYIFVINMVALHAGVCALVDWATNRYNPALLRAYTLFYVVGTAIATRVPPVGMAPFKSLEQLSALLVLLFLVALDVAERVRARTPDVAVRSRASLRIRVRVFGAMAALLLVAALVLAPTGYFGPLSSRVRALFVAHTRTGNPLVDSVAEHTPATSGAYWVYLHLNSIGWTIGSLALAVDCAIRGPTPARSFVLLYSAVAYYFSSRMSRLLILSGPVACLLTAYAISLVVDGAVKTSLPLDETACEEGIAAAAAAQHKKTDGDAPPSAGPSAKRSRKPQAKRHSGGEVSAMAQWTRLVDGNRPIMAVVLVALAGALLIGLLGSAYRTHCVQFSRGVANPLIAFSARLRTGEQIIVDDYLQSYLWLKENTPKDARVLAWWDYGYQITGIGERTTLADGNTWNHEHIATIGKMLTSPVDEAHSLVRHMADYVLIWAGDQGDDLGKSPHMARIGNSVYRDICPHDPLCQHFGFYRSYDTPTPSMRASLLYNLHSNGIKPGVRVDTSLFREVYTSKYGLVRIYKVVNVSKESKAWVADPANRRCDKPGSWICPGQYPPAKEIQDMLAKRIDFSQIEDFNRKGGKNDEYYQAYMERSRAHG